MNKEYIAKDWQDALTQQNLHSFDDIWQLEQNWVEAPNQRRGGWSGVCRIEFNDKQGTRKAAFLKRQAHHKYYSLFYPFGRPTFAREFDNIQRYIRWGVPTVTPIYFHQQGDKSILMTEELTGYRPLAEWYAEWNQNGFPSQPLRTRIIRELAHVTKRIHQNRAKHCAFKFKHIFLNLEDEQVKFSVIDLEQSRYWIFPTSRLLRDVSCVAKASLELKLTDRWRFMRAYFGESTDREYLKRMWHRIARVVAKKLRKKR